MKTAMRLGALLLVLGLVAGSAEAQRKGRKLPEKAYIESAQIAIVSGDTVRYHEAMSMLDSLFMHYGPHPEGYFWMNQISVDFVDKSPGLKAKEPWVNKMAVYRDSLHQACQNTKLKAGYLKRCSEFLEKSDSTAVKYWRIFYNDGAQQYQAVEEALREIKPDSDSATVAFYRGKIKANGDSALANARLAIAIDSTDGRAYLLAGSVLEKQGDYAGSTEWLSRGLKYVSDSSGILLQMAYNKVTSDDYCGAIPHFTEYLKHAPSDTGNLLNLTICYNNCKMYDSAAAVHRRILELNPTQLDALLGLGQYFNQQGRLANDSATFYRGKNDDMNSRKWSDERTRVFDSAKVYFKQAHAAAPDNPLAAEQYAVLAYVTGDFESAAAAFSSLTKLDSTNASHWTSLGDSYLSLKKWPEAASAYERVVAIDPAKKEIWQRLYDIYTSEMKDATKAAAAKKNL